MNKLITVILVAALLAIGLAGSTTAQDGTTISKVMSQTEAMLGDQITVTLTVNAEQAPLTVTDRLPDQFSYIPGTFTVDGVSGAPAINGQEVSCQLDTTGLHTIEFSVEVTGVEASTTIVSNEVEVGNATDILASDSSEVILYPYEGFTKSFELVYEENPDGIITVGELVQWDMVITVPDNFDWAMTDAVVSDNLGAELGIAGDGIDNDLDGQVDEGDSGDLGADYNMLPGNSTLALQLTGSSNKVHLSITELSVESGESVECVLGVFTDYNPGKGKTPGIHSYSSPGTYMLNSGTVLKLIDPVTNMQLSAHTGPVEITVVEVSINPDNPDNPGTPD